MKNLGDIVEESTAEEVKANLMAIFDEMKQVTAFIRASGRQDDLFLFTHNVTEMAAAQVGRVGLWVNEPHDLLAWAARNIIELYLLIAYALLSEDNLKRLFADYLVDAIEIDTRFMKLSKDNTAHLTEYQQQITAHQDEAKRRQLDLKTRPIAMNEITQVMSSLFCKIAGFLPAADRLVV